jgi:hypothetical protein
MATLILTVSHGVIHTTMRVTKIMFHVNRPLILHFAMAYQWPDPETIKFGESASRLKHEIPIFSCFDQIVAR